MQSFVFVSNKKYYSYFFALLTSAQFLFLTVFLNENQSKIAYEISIKSHFLLQLLSRFFSQILKVPTRPGARGAHYAALAIQCYLGIKFK